MSDTDAIRVEPCTTQVLEAWIALREALWPHASTPEHRREAEAMLHSPGKAIAFLARSPERKALGFAEAAIRQDYVNGCTTSPVAFLEGIYVHPDHRGQGVARQLCKAVEAWALACGCTELASDVELENTGSQRMHEALGFAETERVVFYCKKL